MNPWLAAVIALVPPFALGMVMCARGALGRRAAAAQLAGSIGVVMLVCMTFAFGQASSIELPLTLALLGLPAALVLALFVERWL
ncbi:MAG TPA: hypothetical protein VMU93_00050 [Caulobacteraceae bacterium]|nr:hypothetical protein [Caulobacteraceae bacterium]